MADIPKFDLDEALYFLNPFIENHAEGSKERRLFGLAQIALLFIRDRVKGDEFEKFYKSCFDTSFTVEVAHEFATREEADQWLASGKPVHTERVKIAGKGFMVVEVSGKLYFMIAPLPEELETDEWKDDSEE
ncbi:hypothetical protein ATI61_108482 [Archangium gephyra]|uniref:Uncharacterized protein n=1 Tax=Archangium gephyra TaxID=48 RepID=A0ABX9JXR9_9BACT|nr:hypothetical protein [Archangium gephyra]REG28939.1 hypothetical protein ATI61_108482 [Archangium gephyra]